MKKYYQLAFMLFCWFAYATSVNAQSPNSVSEEKTVSDVENRTVYGFVGDLTLGGCGITKFKTDTPQNLELLSQWKNGYAIFSGAAAYGEYYVQMYHYNSDGVGKVENISFAKVSLVSDNSKEIKVMEDNAVKLSDMTFDYSTNTMYAVGFELGDTFLYSIDLQTGTLTKGPLLQTNAEKQTIATLAATYDGRLYGLNMKGILFKINKETGNLTRVMDTKVHLGYMQSMEFDHTDDCLYWATMIGRAGVSNELYKIDVNKKTIKSLGHLGDGGAGTQAQGLYIPFVLAGFDAPGQATELKAVPAEKGALEATITWKNPVKTHGGDDLSGNMNVILERDGEVISSSMSEAGAEMSWTDKSVKLGEHTYTVKAINEKGEGALAEVFVYVGDDVPATITDLMASVGNECKNIKLTWNIPDKGAHGGYYDKSNVRYRIVRYPDNTVLEEEYGGTSYEDNTIKRLGAYYYGITGFNKAGSNNEYKRNEIIIAGKAVEVPYDCSFNDETIARNQWTFVNGNHDGNSWRVNSGLGTTLFNDYVIAAEYVLNPLDSQLDADEWLISPPINFEANKDYYLSFDVRSAGVDELNITFGDLNTVEAQNQRIVSGLFTEEAEGAFYTYQFQLPRTEGIHCVGINLVTMYGDNTSQLFQINNVMIEEGIPDGIETVNAGGNTKVSLDGDLLAIEGDFNTAYVYDTTGICVATLNKANAETTTTGWHPGIYIVKIANADSAYTQKITIR